MISVYTHIPHQGYQIPFSSYTDGTSDHFSQSTVRFAGGLVQCLLHPCLMHYEGRINKFSGFI